MNCRLLVGVDCKSFLSLGAVENEEVLEAVAGVCGGGGRPTISTTERNCTEEIQVIFLIFFFLHFPTYESGLNFPVSVFLCLQSYCA